jgi:NAD(P)H-flavin reductase
MIPKLKFVDVTSQPADTQRRKNDLSSFEYTHRAEITSVYPLTEMETLYRIQIINPEERRRFKFMPGQFVMLEMPGIGEAPFSISSSPSIHGEVELCIRKSGNLTNFLSKVSSGVVVGIRGPFGTGFPMEEMRGQNILLIAGGLGLVPLRSPISYVQENRSHFKEVNIVYGTKSPAHLLFTYQYDVWSKDNINLNIIVEKADKSWKGSVGMLTETLLKILTNRDSEFYQNTYAIVCGPPVMFKFVCNMLNKFHIPMQKMFVSLERRMHCGMGKCCRCYVGSTSTCLKGPVFDYWTVMNLKEAI